MTIQTQQIQPLVKLGNFFYPKRCLLSPDCCFTKRTQNIAFSIENRTMSIKTNPNQSQNRDRDSVNCPIWKNAKRSQFPAFSIKKRISPKKRTQMSNRLYMRPDTCAIYTRAITQSRCRRSRFVGVHRETVSGKWCPGKPCGKFCLHSLFFLVMFMKQLF
jgi:hypothetical protein